MKQKGISQEALKLIACVTMLIDHAGATLAYSWYMDQSIAMGVHMESLWNLYMLMRIIGRIAFPIYCFLLVEGAHYTKNPRKYAARLALGAVLSEIPYDLVFSGGVDWTSNNVMITLLLGFGMLEAMKRVKGIWKLAVILPFYLAAELMYTDYAGYGIVIIAAMALTRGIRHEKWVRAGVMPLLLWFGATIPIGAFMVPLEIFGVLSLVPIFAYKGGKRTYSKAVQRVFYLFYPVHLLVLWLLNGMLFGG